jgi:hypothetical protein
MANPLGFITGAIKAVTAGAQALGKAKGMAERAMDDLDGDQIPEYKNLQDDLHKIFNRLKDTKVVLAMEFSEYKKLIDAAYPRAVKLVKHVFNDAKEQAKAGK